MANIKQIILLGGLAALLVACESPSVPTPAPQNKTSIPQTHQWGGR